MAAPDYANMSDAEIDALHSKVMNAQPSVAAIGTPSGPTPAATQDYSKMSDAEIDAAHAKLSAAPQSAVPAPSKGILGLGKEGLGVAGKVLSTPRGLTGTPLLGGAIDAIQAIQGKPMTAYTADDLGNTVNPTNLKQAPTADQMYERAGIPAGAKLSDLVPGYGEPGKSPWYMPEKGGMLDPTVRGTAGFASDTAIDPLTYLSFGGSALARKAVEASASKMALEQAAEKAAGPVGNALSMAGDAGATSALAMNPGLIPAKLAAPAVAGAMSGDGLVARVLNAAAQVAQAPSNALRKLGTGMYESPLLKMNQKAAEMGKSVVPSDVLYNAGVMSPSNLPVKAQAAVDALNAKRTGIFNASAAAGGTMDMNAAMAPAQEAAAKIRADGIPEQQWVADELERRANANIAATQGKPGVPATSQTVHTGTLDEGGWPKMEEQVTPGTPDVPGKVFTPGLGSKMKTVVNKATPDSAFNTLAKNPAIAEVNAPLAQGLDQEAINAVTRTHGPQAGAAVSDLNSSMAPILSSQKAQQAISNQAARNINDLKNLSGTDAILFGVTGLKGVAAKKAMNAARVATMPVGYGLRSLADGTMTGPTIDALVRQKLSNATAPPLSNNPWSQPQGGQ
jgi:hypothetical protein